MDVLELPRPVINFLRTMVKESCRYALSWDIFGGPDSVTLTLTWKLIDVEAESSMINEISSLSPSLLKQQQQRNYESNPSIGMHSTMKNNNTLSSSRRSRRDDNTFKNENNSAAAILRSSRGKSLEGGCIQTNKQATSHQQYSKEHQHVSSLERQIMANHYHCRSKKEQQKQIATKSDHTCGNIHDTRSLSVVKCATISSLSNSSSPQSNDNNNNNNPLLPEAYAYHQRTKQQPVTPSIVQKSIRSLINTSRTPTIPMTSNTSSNYTKLARINNRTTVNNENDDDADDDDDDELDPWVKRFECSFEDYYDETTDQSEDKIPLPKTTNNTDELEHTSGRVKFKAKPDYF